MGFVHEFVGFESDTDGEAAHCEDPKELQVEY